jgi:4'-phosphopantetheinyl transferase
MMGQPTIYILYTKITGELPAETYKKHLIFLPETLRDQHFRYRRWQDRAANLFSKILLVKGFEKFGLNYLSLENLQYTEYRKPYLSGNVDFNISHSGQYVICAVARNVKLGIDIEEIKPVDFKEFDNLMSRLQWQQINSSPNPLKEFFRFWAIKESIIKADGRGLSIPLNDIHIRDQTAYYEKKWYLRELDLDENYCACLAFEAEDPIIIIEYLPIADLN